MIQPFLVTNGLFGYIDGSIPCPPFVIATSGKEKEAPASSTVNPNYDAWLANDAHVRMLLLSTISEAAFQHVQGTTSRDLWLSLERAYAPHTSSREFTLKTQLLKIQMKGDESSAAYLARAHEYATALANIGQPMPEKDIIMLVVAGLREEYNGVKQNLLAREFTAVFSELPGLLADHEFLIKKPVPDVSPAQAFTASTAAQPSPASNDTIQALQQIAGRLGFQLQPTTGLSPAPTPQPFYTNRSGPNNRGRGGRGRGGRGGNNRSQVNNNRNQGQFSWASNQNTVYGTCNRCGIGHLPSQCPNRDPSTIRSRQPSANYADFRSQSDTPAWLNDTGSNNHVAPDMSGFDSATPYFGEDNLLVGDGKSLPILHIGSAKIFSPSRTFHLKNVLHVPKIKRHLLSVQKFCHDNNVYFEFHSTFFAVKDKSTHTTLLTGPSDGGLYTIRFPSAQPLPRVAFSTYRASTTTWHQRLGHPHAQLFSSMLSSFHLPVSDKNFDFNCSSCLVGKSSKLHLLSSDYHSSHVLDLVFCDVWGPSGVSSFDGHNYFLLCVDHFSKYMWLFPLKRKSEVFETFKRFVTMAERQFSTKVKSVQTDWGGEFRNLSSFFASIGIIHRLSCPHTSEQNGTVERRHRHVVETGLTLMAQAHVPQRFWHFAYDTAVYLINRMPSRNISPFEHLFKHKPNFSFLRVFGCLCFPYLRPYNPHKMDLRSTPCIFLGYSTSHHGYRCFDPESDRIYIARHVRFIEHVFPFSKQTSNTSPVPDPTPYVSAYPTPDLSTTTQPTPPPQSSPTLNSPPQPPDSTPPSSNQPTSTPPTPPPPPPPPSPPPPPPPAYTYSRKPTHSSTTSAFDQYSTNQAAPIPPSSPTPPPPSSTTTRTRPPNLRSNPKQTKPYNASFHTSTAESEPTTFTVANADPNWRKAMAEEYSSLMRHGTWTLVPYDPRSNVVDCKWVYRLKKDQHGCVQRYKARLVAKGFHQQHGIDYTETFSPVVKATTIRVVLSLAVQHKWPLRQLDVQTAFLYGDLKETVYLKQPPGFVDPRYPNHVCRLRKSLYGLKQAPRAWFHRLSSALLALGFKGSNTDPSLFVYCASDTVLYMLVYVDDIILTGNKPEAIDHVVRRLGSTFDIKDMGPLSYFLGISVTRKDGDLHLSQQNYIKELLARANLSHAKPVSSPCTTSAMLSVGDSDPFDDPVKYRQLVGALQYVTLTRPDITFAVNKVCQFMHSPTVNHWAAVKRILRYLLGTVDHTLLFSQSSTTVLHAYTDAAFNSLSAFSDADWAGCPDDRRSTGGYAIYLGSNLVSWSARKQKTVSRSSTESEYKALADAVAELTWLETLLRELRVPIRSSPNLWCDNLGATYLSANPIFHARTKHVEVDFHFVRERVAQGKLKVQFISTKDQLADVFTKPLPADRFLYLKSKLRVLPRT
ncbi:putative RNA-directed DNA polymerase [Helianthus annuus]|nr:putative RNA-directed DNA polymerase [Helianthus annuus]KAJ0711330.1 putative RNA-directed DNA polymerase [Helianthus annuus]